MMQELWEVLIQIAIWQSKWARGGASLTRRQSKAALPTIDLMTVLPWRRRRINLCSILGNIFYQLHPPRITWQTAVEIAKKPPHPLRTAMTKFRKNLDNYNMQNKKLPLLVKNTSASAKTLPHSSSTTAPPLSPKIIFDNPLLKVGVKDFFSTQDAMNDPSFLQILDKSSSSKMREIFICTCKLERNDAADEKKQQAVGAAVAINYFEENIDPKYYPTLHSKQICLKTDKDITAIFVTSCSCRRK
jgi:hypothetical protein